MGLHTRKQLSELLTLDWNNKSNRDKIGMWVKRGSIIEKDGLIDDTDPQNLYWIKKQQEKEPKESIKQDPQKEVPDSVDKPPVAVADHKQKKIKAGAPVKDITKYDLEVEFKELSIEKLKVDTRLQELKEDKIRGEVIPIEIVKTVFAQHSQNIITEFKNSVENILTIFAKKKSLNGNEVAEIRGQMVSTINLAVDKAVDSSKKNLTHIVKEFSIKKEVGERE
jgi:hypothetical protein